MAAAATALTAFNAMFLADLGHGNTMPWPSPWAPWVSGLLVRYLRRDPDPGEWPCPAAVGRRGLTKLSLLALGPLFACAGRPGAEAPLLAHLWRSLLALSLPVLLVGRLVVPAQLALYGDPTGLAPFVEIIGARYPRPTLAQLAGEWPGFVQSFGGCSAG